MSGWLLVTASPIFVVSTFRQFQEMREKDGDTSDMLDAIEAFFEGSGKTRRQIAKKLKAMNLIKVAQTFSK